jgi:hypothetical protein
MVEKKRPKFCRTIYLVCGVDLLYWGISYFILHTSRGNPSKLSPFGLEGLGEDRGCMRIVRHRRWGDELFAHRYEYIIAGLDEAQMSNS